MQVEPLGPFLCPLDRLPLRPDGGGWVCGKGHRHDRAREGYVNLLPVQHKASRDPGDDKAMVAARRRFVELGHFEPLNDALFAWLRDGPRRDGLRLLDAGCGEGHSLAALSARAARCEAPTTLCLAGYDISKWAVRAAARRALPVAWAVASNRHPPLAAASVDLLWSLFGFAHWPSFEALLAPGGRLVTVDAAADHLIELREIIYPEVAISSSEPAAQAVARGWRMHRSRELRYGIRLDTAGAIHDLVTMTPHAHRITAVGRAALAEVNRLDVTLAVMLREWQSPRDA